MSTTEPRESIWIRNHVLFALTNGMGLALIALYFVLLVIAAWGWVLLVWIPGK